MVNADEVAGEFCEILGLAPTFGDLVMCRPIIPDDLWNISDPATCSISNHVITWTRGSFDSFINLSRPASLAPGQQWMVAYEVIEDSGVGLPTAGLFASTVSSLRPASNQYPTLGDNSFEIMVTAQDATELLRWTPIAVFSGLTLTIKNVSIFDTNNIGEYP